MLDKRLKKIISEFYDIPAAPFCINQKSEYIKSYLTNKGLEYEETPYYISSTIRESRNGKRILFFSHLDHPGFIFKNNREGIALGTLYLDKIKKYAPISVYSPSGEYLGDVELEKASGLGNRDVEISSDFDIPKNSQGLWNTGNTKFADTKILGRSHDNDIVTCLMLNSIEEVSEGEYGIHFVFTKHEEVLQQSSYNISRNNSLNISEDDIVINLESMKVYPITKEREYSNLNYDDGPILNISEKSCLYNTKGRNLAESMINNISEKKDVKIQRGLAGGTSDARHIVEFGLTDNVVTLNIPNRYKHNTDGKSIRPEEALIKDVLSVSEILKNILRSSDLDFSKNSKDIQVDSTKKLIEERKSLNILNRRLDIASHDIVRRGYYFPKSILDCAKDFFWKSLSYIYYIAKNGIGSIRVSKD
jgi:hypothetical protein